jgi:PQQ-dependent dehydrogenase (methanol/ethanol family)
MTRGWIPALLMLGSAVAQAQSAVDDKRLLAPEASQWLSVGRTYDEQHYSPLNRINVDNVSQLGLAWFADFDSNRGQEATPLVIDGVIYVSTAWSRVKAYEARTGKLLWAYDPKVPGEFAGRGCCDVVNRGLAAWQGKIFLGAYDGRLLALDAKTGAVVWSVLTVDHDKPYTSTGAPRVVKGKVLIGQGGAELGVRGYVTAYDAESGKLAWRFYTVPGNPANGFEAPILKKVASTWKGEWWIAGGGGTVWDAMAYDPALNLLYIGVGNGSPWNQAIRSPGGGDNLFLSSIVALNPDNGSYVWHYQTTPGETWDYTATQPIVLADLTIAGKKRRVVMQAPKNGFFYVLDAKTGKLLSAQNFVEVNWASGIDMKTGRPIPTTAARYDVTGKAAVIQPSPQGAHSWHPMSFSPQTGLVYFSAVGNSMVMKAAENFEFTPMATNLGIQYPVPPAVYKEATSVPPRDSQSRLIAWDPVNQREVWRTDVLGTVGAGTLATAGGLVFQGTTMGRFVAYRATDGKELWSMNAQTGVVAGPATFEVDGEQYIAEAVGYGLARYGQSNRSRLLVFKLGGTASLPPAPPPAPPPVLDPPPSTAVAETIEKGHKLFASHCAMCHDTSAGNRGAFPDLRYSPMLRTGEAFSAIVLGGALQANGMSSFKGRISEDEAQSIRAYLIQRANDLKSGSAAGH